MKLPRAHTGGVQSNIGRRAAKGMGKQNLHSDSAHRQCSFRRPTMRIECSRQTGICKVAQ